jgi:hypothetical protein
MSTEQELQHLLSKLVEEWPGDDNHPTVRQAREYLGIRSSLSGRTLVLDNRNQHLADNDDQYDAMWFSI